MQKAFSLVELSIVLVILGLLTGGILAGQNLIRAAELRRVSTDLNKYETAIYTFRDKYFALPGDFKDATKFWTAANAAPTTCRTTSSTTTATCDGNGDGVINSVDGNTTFSERFHAWKHLANAGLIEGSYTGVTGADSAEDTDPGVNSPLSKITNAGPSLSYLGTALASNASWFEGDYSRVIHFGGDSTGSNIAAVFSPEEQWNIDTKMDDGRPGIGAIRSIESFTNCNTTTVAATAEYNLSDSGKHCSIIYRW